MKGERRPSLAWSRTSRQAPAPPLEPAALSSWPLALQVEVPETHRFVKAQPSRDSGGGSAPRLLFAEGFVPGSSLAMSALYRELGPLARSGIPVLLTGETGTGKELLARTLHLSSPRAGGPFVAVNCAAIPPDLLELELFGIEKGVATGVERREGKLAAAEGGTLFLDEIGEMPWEFQAKLLRALQEREVQPVGGRPRPVDIRVLSATNADIEHRLETGRFRRDLYYRLAGAAFRIPPLRERPEDIPLLAEVFLRRYAAEAGRKRIGVTRRALDLLAGHAWPGNVRELQNELRRLAHLSGEGAAIDADDVSPGIRRSPAAAFGLSSALALAPRVAALERSLIEDALRSTRWNRSRAALLLGISRNTLALKMVRLGVEDRI